MKWFGKRTVTERDDRRARLVALCVSVAILGLGLAVVSTLVGQAQHGDDVRKLRHTTDRVQRLAQRLKDEQACIEQWASQLTARSVFLQTYTVPRNNAQAAITRANYNGASTTKIQRLRGVFLKLDDTYRKALRENPPPDPPKLVCKRTPPPSVSPGRPARSGGPSRPAATVTAPGAPAVVPEPSARPRATVTATKTRIVTSPKPRATVTVRTTATMTTTARPRPQVCITLAPVLGGCV